MPTLLDQSKAAVQPDYSTGSVAPPSTETCTNERSSGMHHLAVHSHCFTRCPQTDGETEPNTLIMLEAVVCNVSCWRARARVRDCSSVGMGFCSRGTRLRHFLRPLPAQLPSRWCKLRKQLSVQVAQPHAYLYCEGLVQHNLVPLYEYPGQLRGRTASVVFVENRQRQPSGVRR